MWHNATVNICQVKVVLVLMVLVVVSFCCIFLLLLRPPGDLWTLYFARNKAQAALKLELFQTALEASESALAIDAEDHKAWYRTAFGPVLGLLGTCWTAERVRKVQAEKGLGKFKEVWSNLHLQVFDTNSQEGWYKFINVSCCWCFPVVCHSEGRRVPCKAWGCGSMVSGSPVLFIRVDMFCLLFQLRLWSKTYPPRLWSRKEEAES